MVGQNLPNMAIKLKTYEKPQLGRLSKATVGEE